MQYLNDNVVEFIIKRSVSYMPLYTRRVNNHTIVIIIMEW